ncbi:MAG: flagellar biosynthetic protein FliO [Alphaproteobacteria bacterium]|nr:flagellar biosynthetic protein FliO [Alphaproteobacteria bacterium]MCL2506023.1 flagellar biosynthetic protein FliO [Alphaproteobacteria bacterium]
MGDASELSIVRMLLAFSVVLTLIAFLGWFLKYIHTRGFSFTSNKTNQPRLRIIESLALDAKRRIVILRCDEKEHLLLLGQSNDLLITKHINKIRNEELGVRNEH